MTNLETFRILLKSIILSVHMHPERQEAIHEEIMDSFKQYSEDEIGSFLSDVQTLIRNKGQDQEGIQAKITEDKKEKKKKIKPKE